MAAWVALHRADLDLSVLVAPEFTIRWDLGVEVSKLVMYLFRNTPNLMTQQVRTFTGTLGNTYHGFATRGLAQLMRLVLSIFDAAQSRKPAAQSILVITNVADPAVYNTITRQLVQRCQANGMQQLRRAFEFLANYHLNHNVIDPNQQEQQISLVYPILLHLIAQESVVEDAAFGRPIDGEVFFPGQMSTSFGFLIFGAIPFMMHHEGQTPPRLPHHADLR